MEDYGFKFHLGQGAKAIASGFEGVIISRTINIQNINRYQIMPKFDPEHSHQGGKFIDENVIKHIPELDIEPEFMRKENPIFKFSLGDKVKSNMYEEQEGIVTSCSQLLAGCLMYFVEKTKLKSDGTIDGEWHYENLLTLIEANYFENKMNMSAKRAKTGGMDSFIK